MCGLHPKAKIIHDQLIRDSAGMYWTISPAGNLFCIGSEEDVPLDENGYELSSTSVVHRLKESINLLKGDGYIDAGEINEDFWAWSELYQNYPEKLKDV